MVKNALEASEIGQVVTLSCRRAEAGVEFSVHNQSAMSKDVQLQVFQRSFSTKGGGRGLGAYGMKLLCEHYLHGSVRFASTPAAGTTFYARFPMVFDEAKVEV
jgi:signal transduction histidine kinase